jgi:hypothetical protein
MEVVGQRRRYIYPRVYGWVLLRLLAHAGTAALAYGVLTLVFNGTKWFIEPYPMIVAGLCGPFIVRSQLAVLGSGQETTTSGPAARYRRILGWIDMQILEVIVISESIWVVQKAVPQALKVPMPDVHDHIKMYLTKTSRLTPAKRKKELEFLQQTLADPNITESDKVKVLVYRLLELDARGLVARIMRSAK